MMNCGKNLKSILSSFVSLSESAPVSKRCRCHVSPPNILSLSTPTVHAEKKQKI